MKIRHMVKCEVSQCRRKAIEFTIYVGDRLNPGRLSALCKLHELSGKDSILVRLGRVIELSYEEWIILKVMDA